MNRRTFLGAVLTGAAGLPQVSDITLEADQPSGYFMGIGAKATPREPSFIKNCHIALRKDQEGAIFWCHDDNLITAHLDGYAIVPREEYEALRDRA